MGQFNFFLKGLLNFLIFLFFNQKKKRKEKLQKL